MNDLSRREFLAAGTALAAAPLIGAAGPEFVHLRVHGEHSFLDGMCRIPDLVRRVKELGMRAVALTDHCSLAGALPFARESRRGGVKPILGTEIPIVGGRSLLLLARNEEGYRNLLRSVGGGAPGPIEMEPGWLEPRRQGLIALSPSPSADLMEVFGAESFYVELQPGGDPSILRETRALGARVVATSDVHFLAPDDGAARSVLARMGDACGRPGSHLLTPAEMFRAFDGLPEALRATLEIAERCDYRGPEPRGHGPRYPLPAGWTESARYLRQEVLSRARGTYGDPLPEVVHARLETELQAIESRRMTDPFLILADVGRFAREWSVTIGPGRGLLPSSLAAFVLGVTEVDPLRHGLRFERFMDPGRATPHLPLDVHPDWRDFLIGHLEALLGDHRIKRVTELDVMGPGRAAREVARVLGRPDPGISSRLVGLPCGCGDHPSAILLSSKPLAEIVPEPLEETEALGFGRMDFYPADALALMEEVLGRIESPNGERIRPQAIPEDHPATFDLIRRGLRAGLYPLDASKGMGEFLDELQPSRLNEIADAIALFRPGPLTAGMVDAYLRRDRNAPSLLQGILAETRGTLVYQEQVLEAAETLAGFPPSQGERFRRALSRRRPRALESWKDRFVAGCRERGNMTAEAEQAFDWLAFFSPYSFPKCHALAQAVTTSRLGWLKAHHPGPFLTALFVMSRLDPVRMAPSVRESRPLGIAIRTVGRPGVIRSVRLTDPRTIELGGQSFEELLGQWPSPDDPQEDPLTCPMDALVWRPAGSEETFVGTPSGIVRHDDGSVTFDLFDGTGAATVVCPPADVDRLLRHLRPSASVAVTGIVRPSRLRGQIEALDIRRAQ